MTTTETIKMVSKSLKLSLAHGCAVSIEHNCKGSAWTNDLRTAAMMANGDAMTTVDNETLVHFKSKVLKGAAVLAAQLRAFGYQVELA